MAVEMGRQTSHLSRQKFVEAGPVVQARFGHVAVGPKDISALWVYVCPRAIGLIKAENEPSRLRRAGSLSNVGITQIKGFANRHSARIISPQSLKRQSTAKQGEPVRYF